MRVTGDQRVVVVPLNRRGISPLEFINEEMFAANNQVASNGLPLAIRLAKTRSTFRSNEADFAGANWTRRHANSAYRNVTREIATQSQA